MVVNTLLQKDRAAVWHPFTQAGLRQELLPVVSASGSTLVLADGRTILDGISSWWCNLHGHCHPVLANAIAAQATTLDHVLFAGCTHAPAVLLAEELLQLLPPNQSKLFYSDNGSTAVEVALKIAVQYWKNRGERRSTMLALSGGYHGDTVGAMSVGARSIFSLPFEDLLFSVEHLPIDGSEAGRDRCRELCKSGAVAAFIFEPDVQGAAGMQMYDRGVLETYMQICKESEVICIADEVMTGFGRTGPLFVSTELAHPPDLICLSKGLTGGTLPLAVTTCTETIYSAFISADHEKTFFHGHTYTANPIACAAARASLGLSISSECSRQRNRLESGHRRFLEKLQSYPGVRGARVRGTILAFEVEGRTAGYGSPVGRQLRERFLAGGVLLRPLGNVVYVMPPYCTTEAELMKIYECIEACLGD